MYVGYDHKKNFEDFPEHRLNFFKLLRAINLCAFPGLLAIGQRSAKQFQLVIDSIVWAFNHLERNIADTGLNILFELITNMEKSTVANDFFKTYFLPILQDLLGVLTDTFHKPGFRLQATILAKLFTIVENGKITVPLWKSDQSFPNNPTFVREFTMNLLRRSFKNLTPVQIKEFVEGLFRLHSQTPNFKVHLRDFFVKLKEFGGDQSGLFLEETEKRKEEQKLAEDRRVAAVPGLLYQGPQKPRS